MNQLNQVAIIMDGNGRWGLKKKNSIILLTLVVSFDCKIQKFIKKYIQV